MMNPLLVSARGSAGPASGSCWPGKAPGPAGLLSPPAGPGARRAGLAAELPLPRRTLANAAHKLASDDSGQLSSASPTPVPARPSPGDSAGGGSSPGTYSLALAVSGVARRGLGKRQRIQV